HVRVLRAVLATPHLDGEASRGPGDSGRRQEVRSLPLQEGDADVQGRDLCALHGDRFVRTRAGADQLLRALEVWQGEDDAEVGRAAQARERDRQGDRLWMRIRVDRQ